MSLSSCFSHEEHANIIVFFSGTSNLVSNSAKRVTERVEKIRKSGHAFTELTTAFERANIQGIF